MSPRWRRLLFLSAHSQSIDALVDEGITLDDGSTAFCWETPRPSTMLQLGAQEIVDLALLQRSTAESLIDLVGLSAANRALSQSSPGRLAASFGPAHRSRRFHARLVRSPRWQPRARDLIVALDLDATRAAWFESRRVDGVEAVLGLQAALERTS